MPENLSTAVRQRRVEPPHALDDFPTPPWATRALLEALMLRGVGAVWDPKRWQVREPAANRGAMAETLAETFGEVVASDIFDYGAGYAVEDYLFAKRNVVDWTITNPPFRLAERFIEKALIESRIGVAVFVRSAFLESVGRYRALFSERRPRLILQFTERVVLHKGKLAPKGSTATAYCWLVWLPKRMPGPTEFGWIAPCRKRLEREGDYRPDWCGVAA